MNDVVGGGAKKILYTLKTVHRIGLKNSAKALSAHNTCKACGLGMGGQHGGMTNELDEFPSVCNKSVQAQSTDIQPPIPEKLFEHSLSEFRELSRKELEHIGRLATPIYKSGDDEHFRPVSWEWALERAVERLAAGQPERSFFYSSGRSSNEAGFLLQLLARLYGTNNVNNCSYYCHQATGVGLGSTIGTGTATVELADLAHCDCLFVIGANPASNHPRFIHQLKQLRDRGGQVIVINPAKEPGLVKFAVPKSARSMIAGGTDIASIYLQPHIGGDSALLKGLAKSILENQQQNTAFITEHTENFAAFADDITNTSWQQIEADSGIPRARIEAVANIYASSHKAVFAWGMGITHHQHGSDNVEAIANLALLCGMIGKAGAGLLPLRGHSNVQGIGTIGVKPVLASDVLENMERELGVTLPESPGMDTLSCLQAAHSGEIDNALIMGGNLYSATPDSAFAEQALNRIGFKLFLTTTLNQGHLYGVDEGETLILPVLARDEEQQSTTQESMFNYVRLSDGGIERIDNARSEVAIIAELGKGLLPDNPVDFSAYGQHEKIRQTIAKTVPGMSQLEDIGKAKREFHVAQRLLHKPQFQRENGLACFKVNPLPTLRDTAFPLLLASIRSEGQFNSIIYETTDSYRYDAERDTLFMAREDMTALGIQSGQEVSVESRNGHCLQLKAKVFDLPAGNVMAYYPEANVLAETLTDKRSKTPNFKSIAVRVETKR